MDGLLALHLCDMVIEVLRSTKNTARQGRLAQGDLRGTAEHSISKNKNRTPTEKWKREVDQLSNVVYVHTNNHSSKASLLYIFWRQSGCRQDDYERNESNTETRVQNPQSCAWLVVRQNQVGPKDPNQICWHQKNPLADMPTKESFTRDECNHLRLHNIMSFSLFSFSNFSNFLSVPIGKQSVMSKRDQEPTSQWRFTDGETKTNFSSEGETCQLGVTQPVEREGQFSAGFGISRQSSECRRRTKNNHTGTRRFVGTTHSAEVERSQVRRQENAQFCFLETGTTRRNLRTLRVQWDLHGQRLQEQIFETWIHDEDLPCLSEEVGNYSKLLNIFNGSIKDICVEMQKVHVFVNESSHSSWTGLFGESGGYKNTNFEDMPSSFNTTQKLILEHSEDIRNVHTIESTSHGRDRHCLMIKWSSGHKQNYVYTQIP